MKMPTADWKLQRVYMRVWDHMSAVAEAGVKRVFTRRARSQAFMHRAITAGRVSNIYTATFERCHCSNRE